MSSSGSELRGFVFAVVFIVVFGTLLASVPAGLQGPNEDPETIIPIDPSILSGFAESEDYYPDNYTELPPASYEYTLGSYEWYSITDHATFLVLGSKIRFLDIFWFGGVDACYFESSSGQDRGVSLEFAEIDLDAEEGLARYSLTFRESGDTAGTFVVYWNITEYSSVNDAWDNDEASLLHGVGFANTATTNIGALIVSLLFLQLPDVPTLVNLFIAVPIWACIVYVLWFIVKEMIPFL